MSWIAIIAIIIILIVLVIGYLVYVLLPTPMVGDAVELIFESNKSSLCGTEGTESNEMSPIKVHGRVKWRTPNNIGIQWMFMENLMPRSGLKLEECQWSRDTKNPANLWNFEYLGDENHNPTYITELKSLFAAIEWDKIKIVTLTDASMERVKLACGVLLQKIGM